jgi:hypothetical protein
MKVTSGIALAATAAAFFASGLAAVPVQAQDADVKCIGVNGCKGKSECKSAGNACKGQNGCKGQGWVKKKSASDCEAAGGKVLK